MVVDEFTTEVASIEDADCDYIGAKNVVFKDCDNDVWKFYSCDWFIRSIKNDDNRLKRFATLNEIIGYLKGMQTSRYILGRNAPSQFVYYASDVDSYFALRAIRRKLVNSWSVFDNTYYTYEYTCILQPLNQFGGHIVDVSDDADETEVEFVPVWLDDTDETSGRCMFIPTASYDEDDSSDTEEDPIAQPGPISDISAGEKEQRSEYFSVIYVGFYNGMIPVKGKVPYPLLDKVEVDEDWNFFESPFSIRLANLFNPSSGTAPYRYNIDPTQKFSFSFLSDMLPNVRAVFHINGQRYICEKLTATFSESLGMSRLIKGVFYKIV
jgi:hypothetical protein